MSDYLDSLKDIKKELMKEQKTAVNKENSKNGENIMAKEKRLQAEIAEFIKGADIKK